MTAAMLQRVDAVAGSMSWRVSLPGLLGAFWVSAWCLLGWLLPSCQLCSTASRTAPISHT